MTRTALCIAVAAAVFSLPAAFEAVAGVTPDGRANQVPLRFKDANGKVLGRAAWGTGNVEMPFVVMREDKQVFAIMFQPFANRDRTLFNFDGGATTYYETADCSGQAYLRMNDEAELLTGLRMAKVAFAKGGRTLILVASGTSGDVAAQSYRWPDHSCHVEASSIDGAPVIATIDITGKYQAPFSIH